MHTMIYICWLAERLIAASIIWKTNHNLAFTQRSKSVGRKSVPLLKDILQKLITTLTLETRGVHWNFPKPN